MARKTKKKTAKSPLSKQQAKKGAVKKKTTAKKKATATTKSLVKAFTRKLDLSESERMAGVERIGKKKKETPKMSNNDDEQQEFRRQQVDLGERERVVDWKRNNNERKKKPRGRNAKKKNVVNFAPASFAVTDAQKSTRQLVDETTRQVGSWWGTNATVPPCPAPPPCTPVVTRTLKTAASFNSFAALSDERQPQQQWITPITFAPASFATATTPTGVYDPEL